MLGQQQETSSRISTGKSGIKLNSGVADCGQMGCRCGRLAGELLQITLLQNSFFKKKSDLQGHQRLRSILIGGVNSIILSQKTALLIEFWFTSLKVHWVGQIFS